MELYQLRTFIAVAEEENLTRAAQRLNTSQPAVSAHIKALEQELGLVLFERLPKGMALTAPGRQLLEQAASVLRGTEDLVFQARRLRSELTGTVRIGVNTTPHLLRIGQFFQEMAASQPRITCDLRQSMSSFVLADLKAGRLDGGYIFGDNPHPELNSLALATHILRIAAPKSLAEQVANGDWQQLSELPWVWTPPECPWQRLINEAFAQRNLCPRKVVSADDDTVLSNLVIAGAGLGLMLEEKALAAEAAGLVVIWQHAAFPVELSFVYPGTRDEDPIMQAVLSAIRRVWQLSL